MRSNRRMDERKTTEKKVNDGNAEWFVLASE
jgi:hypothetical protein